MNNNDSNPLGNQENPFSWTHQQIKEAADKLAPAVQDEWTPLSRAVADGVEAFQAVIQAAVMAHWEGAAADACVNSIRQFTHSVNEFSAALSELAYPPANAAGAALRFRLSVPDVVETSTNPRAAEMRNEREQQAQNDMLAFYVRPYAEQAAQIGTLPPPYAPASAPSDDVPNNDLNRRATTGTPAGGGPEGTPSQDNPGNPEDAPNDGEPDTEADDTTPQSTTGEPSSPSSTPASTTPSATPRPGDAPGLPTPGTGTSPATTTTVPSASPTRPGSPGAPGRHGSRPDAGTPAPGTSRPGAPAVGAPAGSPQPAAGAAARAGAAGMAGYPGMMAPGARGQGGSDEHERKTPGYLVRDWSDELIGDTSGWDGVIEPAQPAPDGSTTAALTQDLPGDTDPTAPKPPGSEAHS